MSSKLADTAAPADTNLIRSRQVTPLPVGPGGNNPTKRQMNDTNIQLTMMTAQAAANSKYDPPVPHPITKQVTIEKFYGGSSCDSVSSILLVVGSLLIVYGLIAK
jgi:hypothetical protein